MHRNQAVSVVIPAYNEQETIAQVVADYLACGLCDEVIVVNNRSRDATAQRARDAGARVIDEERPGYGSALRAGMNAATGTIITLTEADGSFHANELKELLEAWSMLQCDLLMGSRTRPASAAPNAHITGMGNWANRGVALMLALHGRPSNRMVFSDVGCTARVMRKEFWKRIEPHCRADGPQFSPEMMVAALRAGAKVAEVPVGYHPRRGGISKHGGSFVALARTALKMIRLILARRLS